MNAARPIPPLRAVEQQGLSYRAGGLFGMHPHGTCDTGDDAGSHATARTHAAPGRPGRGRLRSRPARAATVLLAVVAALLALPLQAQAQM